MQRLSDIGLRLLGMLVLLASLSVPAMAANFKTIVVVSIDALHPTALTEANAPLTMSMLRNGSLTRKGLSTTPPKTLIAHSAMMTGLAPDQGGMDSNLWEPGEPTVKGPTIFHLAKQQGYRTGFFYSKPKLGYLVNDGVDTTELSRDDAIGAGVRFLKEDGPRFVFIHVSGLDIVGPEFGWLSPEYQEELSYIDHYLDELYLWLKQTGDYLLVVTSDHAGHGKAHGGGHPDEAKLPFGVVSDLCSFPDVRGMEYSVTDLPGFLKKAMGCTRK